MEAVLTALQMLLLLVINYFMIEFQAPFLQLWIIIYVLAMAATALAVALGCSVEDTKIAQEMLPIVFVPQLLFAGFFVTPELIPSFLRWAQYLCSLTYAVRLALIAEFDRDCGSAEGYKNCQDLLTRTEADPDEVWWYWLVLAAIFVIFRLGALFILRQKASKFL